ncbi:MAG: nitroreductase family protein [Aggregatilineales bacterium]
MNKPADTQIAIHDVLKHRWSPRAFASEPVEPEKLWSLFEAARWAPSGGNSQPWTFIVAQRGEPIHAKFVEAMTGRNAAWAKDAPVLVLTVAKVQRQPGVPNPYAFYDLGQAAAHLSVQAHALGLHVHQMAGFDGGKLRQEVGLPEGYDPATIIAIGYQGDLNVLPDDLRERELQPRTRKPLAEFVFDGQWNQPLKVGATAVTLQN